MQMVAPSAGAAASSCRRHPLPGNWARKLEPPKIARGVGRGGEDETAQMGQCWPENCFAQQAVFRALDRLDGFNAPGQLDMSAAHRSEILLGMSSGKGSYGFSALGFTEFPMSLPIRHV